MELVSSTSGLTFLPVLPICGKEDEENIPSLEVHSHHDSRNCSNLSNCIALPNVLSTCCFLKSNTFSSADAFKVEFCDNDGLTSDVIINEIKQSNLFNSNQFEDVLSVSVSPPITCEDSKYSINSQCLAYENYNYKITENRPDSVDHEAGDCSLFIGCSLSESGIKIEPDNVDCDNDYAIITVNEVKDCLREKNIKPSKFSNKASPKHSLKSGLRKKKFCLVCGYSKGAVQIAPICEAILNKTEYNALEMLVQLLKKSTKNITCKSDQICSLCLNILQEIAYLQHELASKESKIKNAYKSTVASFDALNESVTTEVNTRKILNRTKSLVRSHSNVCEQKSDAADIATSIPAKISSEEKSSNKCLEIAAGYKCNQCNETFSSKVKLSKHSAFHEKRFDCFVCGRFLTTKARLTTHLFKFHGIGEGKKETFSCTLCQKSFGTKAGLAYHMNVAHQVGKKYVCEPCNKVYYYHVPFKSHMLYAHGKKKIVCETCGAMYYTVSKLNTHINAVHRNAKSWHCKICDIKFTTCNSFRQHDLLKHHSKKHGCEYCPAQFRKMSSLYSHLREHSIFFCKPCQTTFVEEILYNEHMMRVHNKLVSKQFSKKLHTTTSGSKKSRQNVVKPTEKLLSSAQRLNLNDVLISNDFRGHVTQELIHESLANTKLSTFNSDAVFEVPSCGDLAYTDNVSFMDVEILNDNEVSRDKEQLGNADDDHGFDAESLTASLEANFMGNLGHTMPVFGSGVPLVQSHALKPSEACSDLMPPEVLTVADVHPLGSSGVYPALDLSVVHCHDNLLRVTEVPDKHHVLDNVKSYSAQHSTPAISKLDLNSSITLGATSVIPVIAEEHFESKVADSSWAILKGPMSETGLGSLHALPPPIDDLDIADIDRSMVGSPSIV